MRPSSSSPRPPRPAAAWLGLLVALVAATGCGGAAPSTPAASPTGDASFVMAVRSAGAAGLPIAVGHVWIRIYGTPDRGGAYDRWIEADPAVGGAYRVSLFRVPVGSYAVHGRAYASSRGVVNPASPAEAPPEFATAADSAVRIDAGAAPGVSLLLQQTAAPASDRNIAPVVTALVASSLYLDSSASPPDRLNLTAAASDANGTPFTFALLAAYDPPLAGGAPAFTPAAGPFPAGPLSASWDPPAGYAGTVTITLAVSDGYATSSVAVAVDVRPGNGRGTLGVVALVNQWPDVRHVTVAQAQLAPGASTAVAVDAVDPDGDPLSYEWRSDCGGSFLNGSLAAATFVAPTTAGTCRVAVTVRDGRGGVNDGSWVDLVVKPPPSAHAPDFTVLAQTPSNPSNGQDVFFYVLAENPATHALLAPEALAASDHGAGGTFTPLGYVQRPGAYGWRWTPPAVCPTPNPAAFSVPFQVTFVATQPDPDPALVTTAQFTFNVAMDCLVR